MTQTDDDIRTILSTVRNIAVVGFSANPARPSHYVAQFLQGRGYRILPVNPGLAGQTHLGEVVWPDLAAVPEPVDMVDIFRASDAVPALVEEALALPQLPFALWMQIGVVHDAAASAARARGLRVVMDRCPKVEFPRLFGDRRRDQIAGPGHAGA